MSDTIVELLKLTLPAIFVLYGMFLVMRTFLTRETRRIAYETKQKNTEIVLPIRLQAYERLALLLERVYPNNLLVRLNDPNYSAREFHGILLKEIREEFSHNLSQQVYVSDFAWSKVKNAIESVNTVINESSQHVTDDEKGIDLAKRIFEKVITWEDDPVQSALLTLKTEISKEF